jgi:predicted transport protein
MPQNESLSSEWKSDLGPDWERIHKTYLHTLGNLTLTGYNSEYSDRSFKEKLEMKGGFKESPIRINKDIALVNRWTEQSIIARANKLAEQAIAVWEVPMLSEDIIQLYKPKTPTLVEYSIEDHPHLKSGIIKELFEEFRKQVLALDPIVIEEYLKLYVAYKAETNFVDVVPQAKRLRLSINIPFPEINDPRGLAKDVSALGRWGNGDVEVGLSNKEELPYVIGLVRQALERQMGQDE